MLGFSPPDITQAEIDEVADTLRSGWLTTGPRTQRFEQDFAAYVGARYCAGLGSATAGLFLGLKALDIGPGDEVITTPYTFAATANVIIHAGARPVLADVRESDFNIDPRQVERAITPKTRAVIPVHFAGHPCDMDELGGMASKHGLEIIEDAAHAIGAEYRGRRIGSLSRLTVFSLHAVKNVTTGEGGMAASEDHDLIGRLRTLCLHGMDKDAWQRFAPGGKWKYDIVAPGYKCNMMDLQAAIGLHQLARAEAMLARRREIVAVYRRCLGGVDILRLPAEASHVRHSWHLFPVVIDFSGLSIGRDEFIEQLSARRITANVHYQPLHLFSYYRSLGFRPGDFPVAERLGQSEVTLPLYTRMSDDDAEDVASAVQDVIRTYRK
jgi:dTDP-4-amino-4,6-dideoxygalactose transaminase